MKTVAGIGGESALEGFALAGVHVLYAHSDAAISAAWASLGGEVGLVILSARAAQVLEDELGQHPDRLTTVMP